MRRTQLYLDEETARVLAAEGRRRGTTVSSLVRDAIAEVYGRKTPGDRSELIERLSGVWADRSDLGATSDIVRRERRSARLAPPRRGSGAEVPARQRRPH